MNILQQEDIIKGLGDDHLMQEAKAPSGQVPQFLVVSEIQRRSDMRKRYEAQQDQPEGTIAEQIMNGGIGSIQAQEQGPPQQGGPPPPNMPNPLPQGQGISPNPNQPPPPQPPNAEIAPQGGGGYAAGGIVRLAGGGRTDFQTGYPAFQTPFMNPADQARMAAQTNFAQQPYYQDPNLPRLPEGSLGGDSRSERSVGNIDLGITPAAPHDRMDIDPSGWGSDLNAAAAGYQEIDAQTRPQARDDFSGYPSMTAGQGRIATPEEITPKDKSKGDWYDPLVTGISNAAKWRGGRGTPQETSLEDRDWEGQRDAEMALVDEARIKAGIGSIESTFAEDDNYDPNYTAMTDDEFAADVQAESNGLVDIMADKSPEVAGAILGSDPSADAQRADAEGVVMKGGKSANTSDQMAQLIESQRQSAWSNALIQMGSGIAGGDMEGGLSRAGDAMAAGQTQVNATTQQNMRQNWADEQQEARLAQRRSEVAAGYGYGSRGGDSSKVASAKWFMKLGPEEQEMVMKYEGREMPNDKVNYLINKAIADAAGQQMPMTEEQIASLKRSLGVGVINTAELGTEFNPVPAESLTGRPPSGTWYKPPNGPARPMP